MSGPARLPFVRLLFVGMVVPVVFSFIDRWLLDRLWLQPSNTRLLLLTMAVLIAQIGLTGWLCARLLENRWWSWGLYVWTWLLVDVHILTAAGQLGGEWFARVLPRSLFAAQIGLALIWATLGSTPWMVRIPICVVGAILLSIPLQGSHAFERELVTVQVIALALLCLALRWRQYRIMQLVNRNGDPVVVDGSSDRLQFVQFGIRHVLYWTTALAVTLGILRAFDLMSLSALSGLLPHFERSSIEMLTAGLLIACVFVIALWASLGSGPSWQRVVVFVIALPTAGLVLAFLHYRDYFSRQRWMVVPSFQESFWDNDIWFVYWIIIAGILLCSSLVILRVNGYRLVRRQYAGRPLPSYDNGTRSVPTT